MRVRLDAALFEHPVQHALLVAFFNYALEERHRIETDLEHPAVASWLAQQTVGLREELLFAAAWSAESEALEPSHAQAVVGRFPNSDLTANPIRLRLEDAAAFLETPLSLLVEDQIRDRDFLLAMFTPAERHIFNRFLARGYVHLQHGGGLGNMRAHVLERRESPSTRHRLWVLFDSDALRPHVPSRQSQALRDACSGIHYYQLSRRHIESYLPGAALNAWASEGSQRTRRRRRAVLGAFFRLRAEQRHHFNMKAGFTQDAQRTDAVAGDLYDDVAPQDRTQLAHGFGPQIGGLFGTHHVTEHDLRRDSGWTELRPVVQTILAFLR